MENKYTELYEKLATLQALLQRHHIFNHAEHGPFADPTRGQGRVLVMLRMQDEISTKDMAYLLGIRPQSLNELLNKLEKGGYVTRTPSDADKRVMMIRLTEKGRNAQQADTDYSGIFNCLSVEEQTVFSEYLDRVIAALEAQVGDESYGDEMAEWMRAARSRMGNEQFERLMAMRGGFGGQRHGSPFARPFGRFKPDKHGIIPEGLPGAERFSPDYDGPMPGHRGGFPFGKRHKGKEESPTKSEDVHTPDEE